MTCDFYQVGTRVMDAYRKIRQTWNSLDYEDMINETLKLLQQNPAMRTRVASGISFLMMDEFQDTDSRQLEIARLLANVENGPYLFFVGDVKQSIYYFRGAEVALFNDVIQTSRNPRELRDNFRSQPGVLQFINHFFAESHLLDAVEAYKPMSVFRETLDAPCVECYLPKDATVQNASEMREQDARFIARRIAEICGGTAPLRVMDMQTKTQRAATFDDVVLLFRRSSYMDVYESALREMGIPYNRVAGAGFFQRREVQDILALLTLVLDPWDEEALVTVLRSPLAGLSDEDIMRMAIGNESLSVVFHSDRIPENFDQPEMLEDARRLFAFLYARREDEPGKFLRLVLERTNYEAILLDQHLGLQRTANLRKTIQMADNFGQSRPATLLEFTRYLEDVAYRELKEGESSLQSKGMGAITLMTIHKAKGLEYPVVFLPEMFAQENKGSRDIFYCHKSFGLASKIPDDDGLLQRGAFAELMKRHKLHEEAMENARVLYVAMTRARDYLVLCGHPSAKRYTWSDVLNQVYGLCEYDHDALVEDDGWNILIKRELPEISPIPVFAEKEVTPDTAALACQIASVELRPAGTNVFSVSYLLSRMTDAAELDTEYEPGEDSLFEGEDTVAGNTGRSYAMARGRLVHKLFEYWDFANNKLPDIPSLIKEAGLGLPQYNVLSEALNRIAEQFQKSELWPNYSNARRIEREKPFILGIGSAMLRGVVDAVIDENLIVDYKTGRPDSDLKSYYEVQLCLYAAASHKLRGVLPERGILWYADYGYAHSLTFSEKKICDALALARTHCETF